ncbi:MAG: hypothetical protein JW850_06890 [Thermoflexales bacterium]|nr:hypothetical protein [Thermoflexales bacterium]
MNIHVLASDNQAMVAGALLAGSLLNSETGGAKMNPGTVLFLIFLLLVSISAGMGFLIHKTGQQMIENQENVAEIQGLQTQLAETRQSLAATILAKDEAVAEARRLRAGLDALEQALNAEREAKERAVAELKQLRAQYQAQAVQASTPDQPGWPEDAQIPTVLALSSLAMVAASGYGIRFMKQRTHAHPAHGRGPKPDVVTIPMTHSQLVEFLRWQRENRSHTC